MSKSLSEDERKILINDLTKNIIDQKIDIPSEGWKIMKEFIATGKNQLSSIQIPSIKRTLIIKLYNNKNKKSHIGLNVQLTEIVRRRIVNDALLNAMNMKLDIPDDVWMIFNKYINTGEEQHIDVDLQNSDRVMVIRLYNHKEKKSYVCLRKK